MALVNNKSGSPSENVASLPPHLSSEVLTARFEAFISDFQAKNPGQPVPLRKFFFGVFRGPFLMMFLLESLCSVITVANLIITKELTSIYLEQVEQDKDFNTRLIIEYLGILAVGLFMWNFMHQRIEFEAHLMGVTLKKVFNGIMHNKMLTLSPRGLAQYATTVC